MNPILKLAPLGFPWPTFDPFLFCVYHDDRYPKANGRYGPAASLAGHSLGQDFNNADGWRMYHGQGVPGFPPHPHRGFETVTIVRRGWIDHADSLGAAARYGQGDVQWLTAGKGIVHGEMFPLLDTEAPNPLELFQIWLNLPARSKMADPHFTMFWSKDIPHLAVPSGPNGARAEVTCIAGHLAALPAEPLAPPPHSWASADDSDVAIWTVQLDPSAAWTLPAASGPQTRRQLYFFAGDKVTVAGQAMAGHAAIELHAGSAVELVNHGGAKAEFLLLQGKPIGEPVAQYGPFVMNTEAEIRQAFADYQRTQFGGWPWPEAELVHGPDAARFAKRGDEVERP
ncbi:MAG TPA: pirin family protein [Ideonella sp.]|uniref:pirin family protein n=1 Tax=Ideonella sp. TaxID=1929293 RepID=UPI002B8714F3|nr:pirin family protein [Ideonella sp.]HSI52148.1 pirin family protein [Ideonella sp.]